MTFDQRVVLHRRRADCAAGGMSPTFARQRFLRVAQERRGTALAPEKVFFSQQLTNPGRVCTGATVAGGRLAWRRSCSFLKSVSASESRFFSACTYCFGISWSELFLAQDSRVLLRNLIVRESDSKAVTRLQI